MDPARNPQAPRSVTKTEISAALNGNASFATNAKKAESGKFDCCGDASPSRGGFRKRKSAVRSLNLHPAMSPVGIDLPWLNDNYQPVLFHHVRKSSVG